MKKINSGVIINGKIYECVIEGYERIECSMCDLREGVDCGGYHGDTMCEMNEFGGVFKEVKGEENN